MKLTIICPKVTKNLSDLVQTIVSNANINTYELIDPLSYEVERYFPALLILGDVKLNPNNCNPNSCWQVEIPEKTMSREQKVRIFSVFKKISEYLKGNEDPRSFTKTDLPKIDNLEEWLRTRNGSLFTVTLEDNRILAIYPDGSLFTGIYDLEIHYSTLVNVEKIFRLFNAKEVLVKD